MSLSRPSDPRRALPAVARLASAVRAQAPELPEWAVTAAVRATLEEAREHAATGPQRIPPALASLGDDALRRARALTRPTPERVINATGIALHTNLGRALLAPEAAAAAARAAMTYGDLEMDLTSGRRGDRLRAVATKLALLAGADAALAVNNNAGALVLAVSALAAGREVVVSRGELVEIGGSFRLPDMIEAAGARLVEVGTTNRTHPEDYRRAIGPATALVLKVHRSNFEVRGFVAQVELPELARLAHEHGVPLLEDLGSAALVDLRAEGLPEESYAPARLRLGADLVCFSGDKLFGGPQAGILLGRADLVDRLGRHALARALRLDKMTLAALDWTVAALLAGQSDELPTLQQLREPLDAVARRAERLAERIGPIALAAGARVALQPSEAPLGGGSLPGFARPSWALALHPDALGANELAARLRRAPTPVIARVAGGAVLLDARTLRDDDVESVVRALVAALAVAGPRALLEASD
jgi:L-seryl-tRNA(Ser) seleniumtransferase